MGFFQKMKNSAQKLPQNRAARTSLISEFRAKVKIELKIKKLEPSN